MLALSWYIWLILTPGKRTLPTITTYHKEEVL